MLVKSKLKYIQTLGQKKFRQEEGLFIAEGPRLVAELLLQDGAGIQEIFALNDWIIENKEFTEKTIITEVTETELKRISQLSTPNKVLAVLRQFDPDPVIETKGRLTLALDDIRDPGNMGTIIRIADWFGVEQIVCSMDSAEIYNPKVVQSSMGSIARVRIAYKNLSVWLPSQDHVRIYATALEGQDISSIKKPGEGIILIGNESRGISNELLSIANVKITIPQKGKAESLNAAVAAGIVLSHLG